MSQAASVSNDARYASWEEARRAVELPAQCNCGSRLEHEKELAIHYGAGHFRPTNPATSVMPPAKPKPKGADSTLVHGNGVKADGGGGITYKDVAAFLMRCSQTLEAGGHVPAARDFEAFVRGLHQAVEDLGVFDPYGRPR